MSARRGLTLVEVVVVAGILLVLAAILTPVLVRAKRAGDEAHSRSNLRQIYLGLEMYRESNGKLVEYGPAVAMGLPELLMIQDVVHEVVPGRSAWRSRCCCHPQGSTGHPDYSRYRTDYEEYFHTEDSWIRYVTRWKDDSIYVQDSHCNGRRVDTYSRNGEAVKLLGVRLNGKIETRIARKSKGDPGEFWHGSP